MAICGFTWPFRYRAMLLLSRSLDQTTAFFSNSPLTLFVSIVTVTFPVPPGGMTLSKWVAKQPQEWVTFLISRSAVPLLEIVKVWESSFPSKTVGKVCKFLSTLIRGAFTPPAENSGRQRQKTPIRMKIQAEIFMFFFFIASPSWKGTRLELTNSGRNAISQSQRQFQAIRGVLEYWSVGAKSIAFLNPAP